VTVVEQQQADGALGLVVTALRPQRRHFQHVSFTM
jgi:hypothetical protein